MKQYTSNRARVGWLLLCGLSGLLFAFIFIFFGSDATGQAAPVQTEPTANITTVGTQIKGAVVGPPASPADTTGMPLAGPAQGWDGTSFSTREMVYPPKSSTSVLESNWVDPVLQTQMVAPSAMPISTTNWEGIPATGVFPPDTDGQVGPNHYVQIVNASGVGSQVRIWDKDGNQL